MYLLSKPVDELDTRFFEMAANGRFFYHMIVNEKRAKQTNAEHSQRTSYVK